MSVYTVVSESEMKEFLRRYDAGSLTAYKGINEGIENTNYFVDTGGGALGSGRYVLTIFEWQTPSELPYFLDLMAYLADAGLSCPHPVADRQGTYLQTLHGKPAALITRLAGGSVHSPAPDHCRQVGSVLAALHETASGFARSHPNKRGGLWRRSYAEKITPKLPGDDARLLRGEIGHHKDSFPNGIPRGTIHADLFRDNVLFDEDRLSGVIDFYYACDGALIYDLAITVNDWCSRGDGSLDDRKYRALVGAYAARRAFSKAESEVWQDALRRAALRFWLSRLHDAHFPKVGHITHVKDADVFKNVLLHRKRGVPPLC